MDRKFNTIEEVTEWFRNEMDKLTEMNLDIDKFMEASKKLDRQRIEYTRETNKKIQEDIMKNFETKMTERYKAFFE